LSKSGVPRSGSPGLSKPDSSASGGGGPHSRVQVRRGAQAPDGLT